MILAIDIGNTTCSFGVFARPGLRPGRAGERGKLEGHFSIGTQTSRTPDEITLQLKALAKTHKLHLSRASQIIVCSVVPRMSALLIQALRSLEDVPIRVVGQDLTVPLVNRYTYPEQVGQDRLVGAYAAWTRFRNACIVADFGTAITIDVVTKAGEYLGGVIVPGLEISLEALATRTALLPKVELKEPPELLGRDTANSIRSGLIHGCAALCDGLIGQLKAQHAPKATVVATGGASPLITKYAASLQHLRPHLVLEGLAALASPGQPAQSASKTRRSK